MSASLSSRHAETHQMTCGRAQKVDDATANADDAVRERSVSAKDPLLQIFHDYHYVHEVTDNVTD
jgi:hypothetical protein